jgi:hypothetical protein
VGLAYILGVDLSIHSLSAINLVINPWIILITVSAFFISYLFGSVVRLFANDFSEWLSGIYLRKIRRKKERYAKERFPYPVVADEWIKKCAPHIFKWYKEQYSMYSEELKFDSAIRKFYYNKCKADLYAIAPERAKYHARIESFVRFLAGSLVSNIILLIVSLPFGIYFLYIKFNLLASIYIISTLSSLLLIIGILERFRHQHTREVVTLWTSYYEACRESARCQR